MMKCSVKYIGVGAPYLPNYGSDKAAGADLRADLEKSVWLKSGETQIIPTGIKIDLPNGYHAEVRSRSGLAAKNKVFVLNSPGTIDEDYKGEIKVILTNLGMEDFVVHNGDRIAQLVLMPYSQVDFQFGEMSDSQRGENGLGSTGIK